MIDCLAAAMRTDEIAGHLQLTRNTVKEYLKTIYQKAQVHSARELLVRLYGSGPAGGELPGAQLLEALERLVAAASRHCAHNLTAAVRDCCRADEIEIWRWVRFTSGERLLGITTGLQQPVEPRAWYRALVKEGFAAEAIAHRHALGIRLRLDPAAPLPRGGLLPAGPTLLVAWRTGPHPFSPLETAAFRLLARVAELHWRPPAVARVAAP